ncbi:MAG: DNA-3-methyladenine glycosylase 2 [FCB group bacterium]|nr:DNA-3-methyladenine glycosylase 2 [FCB group bacterium]
MPTCGKFIIRPTGPYDINSSLAFHRRSRFELVDRFDDRLFIRTFEFENRPVLINVATDKKPQSESLTINWSSPGKIKNLPALRSFLSRMFYLDFDIRKFYSRLSDKEMKTVVRRFRGLRPILTPTIFESAAWAIIGQQINLQFAYKIKSNLIKHINRSFVHEGEKYYLFPQATDIVQLDFQTLKDLKFSRQKATYLLGLARLICDGQLDLQSLFLMEYQAAIDTLMEIKGIGVWTANYILMRGLGHHDAWPIGDSGINQAVRNLYGLNRKPDTEFLIELGEKWRPYRSLAALYLWKSL